jgi:hypothetical protein
MKNEQNSFLFVFPYATLLNKTDNKLKIREKHTKNGENRTKKESSFLISKDLSGQNRLFPRTSYTLKFGLVF